MSLHQRILDILKASEKPLTATDISAQIGVGVARIMDTLNLLRRNGILTRTTNQDGRTAWSPTTREGGDDA